MDIKDTKTTHHGSADHDKADQLIIYHGSTDQPGHMYMDDPSLDIDNCPPEFTLVPKGTTRGKDMLVESPGYSYTVRKETTTTRFWWCTVRPKGSRCPASVSERGGTFIRGAHSHTHLADPACLLNKQLSRQIKDSAADNVFLSASVVVDEYLKDLPPTAANNIPRPETLVRKVNRFRQNQRPEHQARFQPYKFTERVQTEHVVCDSIVTPATGIDLELNWNAQSVTIQRYVQAAVLGPAVMKLDDGTKKVHATPKEERLKEVLEGLWSRYKVQHG